MELVDLYKSNRKYKKYAAVFEYDDGTFKTVHFGDNRYSDYLQHKNVLRRNAYISRHRKELQQPPDTAGQLSMWILWGPYTSLNKNISYFKKKFNV